jgi:hypothetical protein
MKKNMSLFLGVVAIVLAALIFSGCPTEAETNTVTTTKFVAADLSGLRTLLADETVSTVDYYGDLYIGNEALVIRAGKTVNVQNGGIFIGDGSLAVDGALYLPGDRNITVSGNKGQVFGKLGAIQVVNTTGATQTVREIKTSISAEDFDSSDAVAVLSVAPDQLAGLTVPEGKTLYVVDTLSIGDEDLSLVGGTVKALGSVVISGESVNISSGNLDFTEATLESAADVTVTVGDDTTVGAITATGAFTSSGGSLTVNGAAKFAGDATFSSPVTFNGDVNFAAAATLSADSTLAAGKTLTVAGNATLTVGSEAALTVDGTLKVAGGGGIVMPEQETIGFEGSGEIELEKGATLSYGESPFIGSEEATYTWGDSTDGKVTLKTNQIELAAGSLTAAKATEVEGTITVAESATLAIANVKFTVGDTGTLSVAGAVTAGSGSEIALSSEGEIKFEGNGKIELEKGAILSYDETPFIGADDAIYTWGDGTDGKVTLQANQIELAGTLTAAQNTGVDGGDTIKVAENATLKIAADVEFTVQGTLNIEGEIVGTNNTSKITLVESGENGATPSINASAGGGKNLAALQAYGSINRSITIADSASNFYDKGGSTPLTSIYASTYTWGTWTPDGGQEITGWQRTALDDTGTSVQVDFKGLGEKEEVTLSGEPENDLSWAKNDELIVTVSGLSGDYSWELDGKALDKTGTSLTLKARELLVKQHRLTVFVTTTGGAIYSGTVIFTVAE